MKIKAVEWNGRRRAFKIAAGSCEWDYPAAMLKLKPTRRDPIVSVVPDAELGNEGFTYELKSGREETVLMDQVLEYHRDPEYLREMLLYKLTVEAERVFRESGLTKRGFARRLKTSPTHLYRLLDTSFKGKTIDQMVRLLAIMGRKVDLVMPKAA